MTRNRRAARLLLAYAAVVCCMMLLGLPKSAWWFAEPWQTEAALLQQLLVVTLSIWANVGLRREAAGARVLTGMLGLYAVVMAAWRAPAIVAIAGRSPEMGVVWSIAIASSAWVALLGAALLCRPWELLQRSRPESSAV